MKATMQQQPEPFTTISLQGSHEGLLLLFTFVHERFDCTLLAQALVQFVL
jgi:hypothetical protein